MRALTVSPGVDDSARLEDVPEPDVRDGAILVQTLEIGICGTDREIHAGKYGRAPDGSDRLVIGHESLGRVLDAPAGSGLARGDLVVGIVRRPDPVPCSSCAIGEWDMCRNGLYTERGISGRDGYAAERFRIEPSFAVRIDPALGSLGVLLEPASIVAKAWQHVERIGQRASFSPERVLVTGAGPIGLLAAMMAVQRGLETRVLDRAEHGPKPALVRALGATYGVGSASEAARDCDVVIECTGADEVVRGVIGSTARNGIVCLTGVSSGGRVIPFDVGAFGRRVVLQNDVVFGTVNANRSHYAAAAEALARADRGWLASVVSRRVPLERWPEAFERRAGDVKVVLDLSSGGA